MCLRMMKREHTKGTLWSRDKVALYSTRGHGAGIVRYTGWIFGGLLELAWLIDCGQNFKTGFITIRLYGSCKPS